MTEQASIAISNITLMVFAHSDDETLLAGALIPKLVHGGRRVHLLCVAPGDDADRSARMELAAGELGVESVSSLRYSPAAEPDKSRRETAVASPTLISAPEEAVISLIEGKMTELEPSMIVTHSPSGDYGHPDHALCHRLTVAAAESVVPNTSVYALDWPRPMLWLNGIAGRMLRAPARKKGGTLTGSSARTADAPPSRLSVTQIHDVGSFLPARKRAARHYKKELSRGPLPLRLLEAAPTWLQWPVLGKARLSRVR
jgi:LmbE family N-acetylglucosaminyl deacetylase